MSKKSWKKEFYPIPADECRSGIPAIKHSLKKWEGRLPENLEKHDLRYAPVSFNVKTCSLCQRYMDRDAFGAQMCRACPIVVATGRDCSQAEINPQTMINLLKKTLEFHQNKRKPSARTKKK